MIRPIRSDELIYPSKVSRFSERIAAASELSAETLGWLKQTGICAPNSQMENHFKAIASGAFASVSWPDAPVEHHRIISDALCGLAFAVDDMYDGDTEVWTHSCSLSELRTMLPRFLVDGNDENLPDQGIYRAAVDLRTRLKHLGATQEWLRGFALDVEDWLCAVDRERRLKQSGQIPTVEHLLDIRLASAAVCVFANFIQTAYQLNIPYADLHTQELCELRQMATRIAVYANDFLSYTRESNSGHVINVLTALRHHEGLSLSDAMNVLRAMHNDETECLHHAVRRILALHPYGDVALYVKKLELFVHGLFVWGLHAARYAHDLLSPSEEHEMSGIPEALDPPSTAVPEHRNTRHQSDSGAVAGF